MAAVDINAALVSPAKLTKSNLSLPGEPVWFELEASTLENWPMGDAVGVDYNIDFNALSPINAGEFFELSLVLGDGTVMAEKSVTGSSKLNLDLSFSNPPTSLYLIVKGGDLENTFSTSDFEIVFSESPRFGSDLTSNGVRNDIIETALVDQKVHSEFQAADDVDTFNLSLSKKDGIGQSEVSLAYTGGVSAEITITDTITGQSVNNIANQPIENLPLSDQDTLKFFSNGSLTENFVISFKPADENTGAYSFELSGDNLAERLETSPWIQVGDTVSSDFYHRSGENFDGDEFTVTKGQPVALSDLFQISDNTDGVYLSLISTTSDNLEITVGRGSSSEQTFTVSSGPPQFLNIEDFYAADFHAPGGQNGSVQLGALARRVTEYNNASGGDPNVLFDPFVETNQDDSSAFLTATVNNTDFDITTSVSNTLAEGTSDTITIKLDAFDQSINNGTPLDILITNYSKDVSFSADDPNLNVFTFTLQSGNNAVPIFINEDSDYSEIENIKFEFEIVPDDGASIANKALLSNFLIAPLTTQIKELVPQFELSVTNAEVLAFDGTNVFEYQIKLTNAEAFVSAGETVNIAPQFANNAAAFSIKDENDSPIVTGVEIVNLADSTATFKISLSDSSVFSGSPEKVIELISHEISVAGSVKNIPDSPAITVTAVDQTASDNPSKWEFVGTDYNDVVIASAVEMDASLGLGDDVLKISSSGALNGGVIDFGDGKDTADLSFASLSELQFDIVEGGGLLVEEQGTNRKVELRNIETIVVSSVDYNPEYLEQLSEPLSLSVISETEDSALLGIYKNDDYTSLSSISDLIFEFAFDPVDINIQDGSIAVGDLALNSSSIDNANGTLEVNLSGALITDFTDPLVEFSVDKLNKNTAFEISIEELSINSVTMDDVDEVLNFASVDVQTTVVLRNGNSLEGVNLKYEFSTSSDMDFVAGYDANSTTTEKIKRSQDLKITGEKNVLGDDASQDAVNVNDVSSLLRLVSNADQGDAYTYISSDVNGDGVINVNDVSVLLRVVSKADTAAMQWKFIDNDQDVLSSISKSSVFYNEGVELQTSADSSIELVAILVGDVNGSYGGI